MVVTVAVAMVLLGLMDGGSSSPSPVGWGRKETVLVLVVRMAVEAGPCSCNGRFLGGSMVEVMVVTSEILEDLLLDERFGFGSFFFGGMLLGFDGKMNLSWMLDCVD